MKLGIFHHWDLPFVLNKLKFLENKRSSVDEMYTDSCGTVEKWIKMSSHTYIQKLYMVISLEKRQKIVKFSTILIIMKLETSTIMALPNFKTF